jgi:hypothetical protein
MEKEKSFLTSRGVKAGGAKVLATSQGDSNGLKDSVSHDSYPESRNGHAPIDVRIWRSFVCHSRHRNAIKRDRDYRINQRTQQPPKTMRLKNPQNVSEEQSVEG